MVRLVSRSSGWETMVTYQGARTIGLSLTMHHGTMDVRNDVVGVRNVMADVRNRYVRIDRKFGLEVDG